MVTNTSFENLPEEVKKTLDTYNQNITTELNKAFKELADQAADELKQGKPYHNRTGQYAADFAVTNRKGSTSIAGAETYTVYNKKHYQITHLLEFGHLTRNGKRAAAYPHWQTALDNINKNIDRAVQEAVSRAGS